MKCAGCGKRISKLGIEIGECTFCHNFVEPHTPTPASDHCTECGGNGYHTEDCPRAKPQSSACKREPFCVLQVGHAGFCSPTFEPMLRMSNAEAHYRSLVFEYEPPVRSAQAAIWKYGLGEALRSGIERNFAAAMLWHARRHAADLRRVAPVA